ATARRCGWESSLTPRSAFVPAPDSAAAPPRPDRTPHRAGSGRYTTLRPGGPPAQRAVHRRSPESSRLPAPEAAKVPAEPHKTAPTADCALPEPSPHSSLAGVRPDTA